MLVVTKFVNSIIYL